MIPNLWLIDVESIVNYSYYIFNEPVIWGSELILTTHPPKQKAKWLIALCHFLYSSSTTFFLIVRFASPLSLINTAVVSSAFFCCRVLPGPVRINQSNCPECLLVIHFFNQIKQLCPIYRLLKHWIKWRERAEGLWAEREGEPLTVSVNKVVLTQTLTDRPRGWAGTWGKSRKNLSDCFVLSKQSFSMRKIVWW